MWYCVVYKVLCQAPSHLILTDASEDDNLDFPHEKAQG